MLSSPNTGMQAPLGPVGTSQPTAPISSGTHIDPSSMQRAYAALGLPYGNQPGAQTQVAGQQPTQTQQQMRSMPALGINFKKCFLRKSGLLQTIWCSMFIINLESCYHSVTSSCIILITMSCLPSMHTQFYCITIFTKCNWLNVFKRAHKCITVFIA